MRSDVIAISRDADNLNKILCETEKTALKTANNFVKIKNLTKCSI